MNGGDALPARLRAALGCAWLASESFFTGFLTWPIGALVLWRLRAGRRALATWCAAAIVELAIYAALEPRLGHPRVLQSLAHPLAALRYATAMLGAALTSSAPAALALAAALLADYRHRSDAELGDIDDGADGAAVRRSAEILERYRLSLFR